MSTPLVHCQCRGDSCGHHRPLEPCPNQAVPPISVIHDPDAQRPVPNSEYGFCEDCWANRLEKGELDGEP
jgi:hypothetical protein